MSSRSLRPEPVKDSEHHLSKYEKKKVSLSISQERIRVHAGGSPHDGFEGRRLRSGFCCLGGTDTDSSSAIQSDARLLACPTFFALVQAEAKHGPTIVRLPAGSLAGKWHLAQTRFGCIQRRQVFQNKFCKQETENAEQRGRAPFSECSADACANSSLRTSKTGMLPFVFLGCISLFHRFCRRHQSNFGGVGIESSV
jgi:hypothetical protein